MQIDVTFPGGKRVDAHFDGFTVATDQPRAAGGEGSAPGPYELFLASLATCAGIYALGFCQARHIPSDGLALRQHVSHHPATGLADRIRLEIVLPTGFPEKYVAAITRAVDQCKVRRTLLTGVAFEVVTSAEHSVAA